MRHIVVKATLTLVLALAVCGLSGCYTAYKSAMDERTVGQQWEDRAITTSIQTALLNDEEASFLDVSVFTYFNHVYLVGEFEKPSQRDRALQIARNTEDVREVTSYFLAADAADHCGATDNLGLIGSINKAMLSDDDVVFTNVDLGAVQCHIVLLGVVRSEAEKARASEIAKATQGVRKVVNYLRVAPSL